MWSSFDGMVSEEFLDAFRNCYPIFIERQFTVRQFNIFSDNGEEVFLSYNEGEEMWVDSEGYLYEEIDDFLVDGSRLEGEKAVRIECRGTDEVFYIRKVD